MSQTGIDNRARSTTRAARQIPMYLSSASLLFVTAWLRGSWEGLRTVMAVAKQSGFDGVEWLLVKPLVNPVAMDEVFTASKSRGLGCRFHQMWSALSLSTFVFRLLKLLPSSWLIEQNVSQAAEIAPTVTFASYEPPWSSNNLIQTGGNMGTGVDSIEALIAKVKASGARLAFDLMHYLELMFGGFAGLSWAWHYNSVCIQKELTDFFIEHQNFIGEIHLYQCRPMPKWLLALPLPRSIKFAYADMFCKNLRPDSNGMFDLPAFLRVVKASGWTGPIVLEIHPLRLACYTRAGKITRLQRSVRFVQSAL